MNSHWRKTLDELLAKIEDREQLDELHLYRSGTIRRSPDQPDCADDWATALSEALVLGNKSIVDFVLKTCTESQSVLNKLSIYGSHGSKINTSQLWQCVAQLKVETLTISAVILRSDSSRESFPKVEVKTLELLLCKFESEKVAEDFSRLKNLKKLSLISTGMLGKTAFPDLLKLFPTLEEFRVWMSDRVDSHYFVKSFAATLATHPALKKLSFVKLQGIQLLTLLNALEKNKTIECLLVDILGNPDLENESSVISKALGTLIGKNSSLREISFLVSGLGGITYPPSTVLEAVINAVGASRNITKLRIHGPKYPQLLKPLIGHPTLEILDLKGKHSRVNHHISSETFDDLIRFIETAPKLKELALPSFEGYNDDNISLLIDAVANAKKLVALDILSVAMEPAIMNRAVAKVAQNPRLKHLVYKPGTNLSPDFLSNNSTFTSIVAKQSGDSYDADDNDSVESEWENTIDEFLHKLSRISSYNLKLDSVKQSQILQAYTAFFLRVGISSDVAKLVMDLLMTDLAGAKTSVHMRELNRNAAGLPPRSPWRSKLDEIINSMPDLVWQRLSNQDVDYSLLKFGDRPANDDQRAWRILVCAAICTSNQKLLTHVLKSQPPALTTLFVGKMSGAADSDWLIPDTRALRDAIQAFPIENICLRALTLPNEWFEQLDYFSFAYHLRELTFMGCESPDEPYGKLIRGLKMKKPIKLQFMGPFATQLPTLDIFTSLGKSKSIGELHYPAWMIHDGCVAQLNANPTLQVLEFTGRLLRETCSELAMLLAKSSSLRHLVLRASALNDDRVMILAKAFKASKHLQTLDLSDNSFTREQEEILIDALQANQSIKKIIPWAIHWDETNRQKYTALLGKRLDIPEAASGERRPLALTDA